MLSLQSAASLGWSTIDVTNASNLLAQGFFALTLDVRTLEEYESAVPSVAPPYPPGHIGGAYFVDSLGSTGLVPADILGCRHCNVAVYCRTGRRSRAALDVLEAHAYPLELGGGTAW